MLALALMTLGKGDEIEVGATNWGSWGNWYHCAGGKFMTAFKVKLGDANTWSDDTGMNGLRVTCGHEATGDGHKSKEGEWGEWGSWHKCPAGSHINGVRLWSKTSAGRGDDTSANNVDFHCKGEHGSFWNRNIVNADNLDGYEGVSNHQDEKFCPEGMFISGFKTKVEDPQGWWSDDTALNRIKFMCSEHTKLISFGKDPAQTLGKCEGDCDNDSHCAPGLECFQRDGHTPVPGCGTGGNGDVVDYDYCTTSGLNQQCLNSSERIKLEKALKGINTAFTLAIGGLKLSAPLAKEKGDKLKLAATILTSLRDDLLAKMGPIVRGLCGSCTQISEITAMLVASTMATLRNSVPDFQKDPIFSSVSESLEMVMELVPTMC